jgi:predicted patatin/cPLA2 family phospholipase
VARAEALTLPWAPAGAAWLALVLLLTAGCAAPPQRPSPLPVQLVGEATIPGIPQARIWGDEAPAGITDWLELPEPVLRRQYAGIMDRPHSYLVLSGGGGDGAYGAGLLAGWSARGSRPEFQIVTGISTGALIAPFAFLGPEHDGTLREVYTRYGTEDLIKFRSLVDIVRGDATADTGPLRRLIAKYVSPEVVAAIAAEGRKGRSLFVGTTNLDAGRPVIWDITRIAASGAPHARDLIHDVMLASTAIPGAFPPERVEVEANGQRYDELHVDGGVTAQLFFSPAGIDWRRVAERLRVQGAPDLYLVRNSQLSPRWETVRPRLLPVLRRTVSTLIRSQGIGDLARLYVTARRHGLDYHLSYIPESFDGEPSEPFDREYMGQLFALGYERASQGYPWTEVEVSE